MTVGIYKYTDLKTNEIVYIGKDSNIDTKKRHRDHTERWAYNKQHINRIIQNNPNRYQYGVLKKGDFNENLLNALEILYIRRYNPLFNFTIGGEGIKGKLHPSFKHYARVISDGKTIFTLKYNGKKICSNKNKEFLQKLADKLNNSIITIEKAKQLNKEEFKRRCSELRKNKPHSKQHSINIGKSRNKTGFYRVTKSGGRYRYGYYKEGKSTSLSSNNLNDLKQKVINDNLEWFIIDYEKAMKTMEEC